MAQGETGYQDGGPTSPPPGSAGEPAHEEGEMAPSTRTPSPYWFPFYHEIIRSGIWSKLSKRAKAVLPVICCYADFKTGECYPSLGTIARDSGVGRSWVAKAVTELVSKGLLIRKSGNSSRSNRYKLVIWGSAVTALPQCHNGPTPSAETAPGVVPQRHPNYNQVTINNVTTTINDGRQQAGRRRSPSSNTKEDLTAILASELGLKTVGIEDLEALLSEHGEDRVRDASKEAVSQGKPTLKYVRGILRNWSRTGTPDRASRREKAEARSQSRAESARRDREEDLTKSHQREEAYALAQKRLGECSPKDIAELVAEAEREADEARIPGLLRESYIQSRMLLRIAERHEIKGI